MEIVSEYEKSKRFTSIQDKVKWTRWGRGSKAEEE